MTTKRDTQLDNLINKILKKHKNAKLSKKSIGSLLKTGEVLSFEKDQKLFEQGDPTSSVFITVTGSFSVYIENDNNQTKLADIGVGEFIGEMGIITGASRSATVIANRNSKVIELNLKDMKNASVNEFEFLLLLSRVAITRLLQSQNGRTFESSPSVFCFLGPNAEEITSALSGYMKKFGSVGIFSEKQLEKKTISDRETSQGEIDFTIYYSENISNKPTAEIEWMIQNSDRSFLIFNGEDPKEQQEIKFNKLKNLLSNYDAIIKWPESKIIPGITGNLLDSYNITNHYHYIDSSDLKRMSRILTGNGIALVLSGGGARGMAHMGFYKFALENKFEFDLVVGTSSGSLVGAGIALAWSFDEIVKNMSMMAKINPLFNLHIPKTSIFKDKALRLTSSKWFSDLNIEDTRIAYRNISVDVENSKESVNSRGRIEASVRASGALPGIFPPVKMGNTLHVDGGVMNNLPTDQTTGLGIAKIIGIDIGADASPEGSGQKKTDQSIFSLITLVATLGDAAGADLHRKQCDVLLLPDVSEIKIFDFKLYEKAISIGYECSVKNKNKLDEIFNIL